jgi:hypothetical protein
VIPFRRGRGDATGLEVVLGEVPVDAAGEQPRAGGKISADQARALYAADECVSIVRRLRIYMQWQMEPADGAGES